MAGEVEESFGINFQADSIHSGSISFGRFESEPLSWERRSSFNHNRYLEEVEKCSKPGSVIEKKAYFEAHFKKRGLFGFMPSTGHDGSNRATSESDGSERIGNQEDFESNDGYYVQFDQTQGDFEPNTVGHHVPIEQGFHDDFEPNEDNHYGQFDQRSQEDFEPDEGGQYVKMEQRSREEFELNEDGCPQFDDIPVRSESDYQEECEVIGYGRGDTITECPMVSFPNPQIESAMDISNDLEDATNKNITLDEAGQSDDERSNVLSANDDAIIEVKRDNDGAVNTAPSCDVEPAQDVEKTILCDPANPSPKPEPALNSEVNNVRVQKSTSRSSRNPGRNPSRGSPRRTNMEKSLSKLATPTSHSATRTPKEVSKSVEKLTHESKSEKTSRVKKAVESQSSVLKTDSRGTQEAQRLNPAFSSTMSDVRPRATAFNFKCSERAERRKEFYMKLEEKLHAKEAEMNQKQAISQEKKEADIKKLRKSLNFKATPMPSFYRTTLPSQSHGNEAVSSNTRSKKLQNKPKCPGSGSDAAMPLKSKMGNDQAAEEYATTTKPHSISTNQCTKTKESEASLINSPSPSTFQSRLSNSVTKNHTSEKKEGVKVTSQKHRAPESYKEAEVQSNGGYKNGKTTKQRNEIMKKSVRNVGLRSSSRSGNNLTVGVAS